MQVQIKSLNLKVENLEQRLERKEIEKSENNFKDLNSYKTNFKEENIKKNTDLNVNVKEEQIKLNENSKNTWLTDFKPISQNNFDNKEISNENFKNLGYFENSQKKNSIDAILKEKINPDEIINKILQRDNSYNKG